MFFAETLGPALTQVTGAALTAFVKDRLAGRGAVSGEELHAAVADFLRSAGNSTKPEAAIAYLVRRGWVAESGGKFRIAG